MVLIGQYDTDKRAAIVAALDDMKKAPKALELGADILELRLDLMDSLPEIPDAPCIATNRLQKEGGKWTGSEEKRRDILKQYIPLAGAIDIELCAENKQDLIETAHSQDTAVIISSHFFHNTPTMEQMQDIIDSSFGDGASIAKLAVMPQNHKDILNLLELTLNNKDICTIAMGNMGKHTRIIAPCYGSVLTYGSIDAAIAPGQLRTDQLKTALEMVL